MELENLNWKIHQGLKRLLWVKICLSFIILIPNKRIDVFFFLFSYIKQTEIILLINFHSLMFLSFNSFFYISFIYTLPNETQVYHMLQNLNVVMWLNGLIINGSIAKTFCLYALNSVVLIYVFTSDKDRYISKVIS